MADGLSHNRKAKLDTKPAQIAGAHMDFPVLFTAANLPSEMLDSDGSFPARDGGGDIRFTSDMDGNNDLPCEVVAFVTAPDPANGAAEIWVKVPNVRDTQVDTVYVWYNAPASASQPAVTATNGRNAVWSGVDYMAVFHLSQSSGDPVDSTGNNSNATFSTAVTYDQPAMVGRGINLNKGRIDAPYDAVQDLSGVPGYTLSVWMDAASSGDWADFIRKDGSSDDYKIQRNNAYNDLLWHHNTNWDPKH